LNSDQEKINKVKSHGLLANKRRLLMKKKLLAVACGLSLLLAAGACKKKEEQPLPKPGMPGQQQLPPGMPPHGAPGQPMPGGQPAPGVVMPKGETTVAIPEAVKGKWKSVIFVVQDKQTNKATEVTANLHSDVKVPNSDVKITVGDFLPDFRMNGLQITSASDEPNNPAVGIKVFEGGKQIFPEPGKKWGWLYGKPELRNVHPFEHPKYSIVLKSAQRKG
jgi:hypothetical protein